MPTFFFHYTDQPDITAVDLPDRKFVRGEAIQTAADILKDFDRSFTGKDWVMTVNDELGELVIELTFSVREST